MASKLLDSGGVQHLIALIKAARPLKAGEVTTDAIADGAVTKPKLSTDVQAELESMTDDEFVTYVTSDTEGA